MADQKFSLAGLFGSTYRCGTLRYTFPKLMLVFFWLMVGGFVYSVCLNLPGSMLPIQLKALGVSDTVKMLLLTTIGGTLNMTVCPYIGFVSDRHRGRWGRRIPYILMSLPFLAVSLFAFGFTDRIGPWLAGAVGPWAQVHPVTMTVWVIAIVMFMFQFFLMFVGSVIWYIFNDVIPKEFFGQVMAAFQIATTGGSALFNLFVFEYAGDYYRQIFIGGAILYGAGMLLMCLFIKEGEYPPVEGEAELRASGGRLRDRIRRWGAGFAVFLKDSFSHRFYVFRYLLTIATALAGVAGTFAFYQYQEFGLELRHIGQLNGYGLLIGVGAYFLILVVAGVLVNRWHPVRITIYNLVFAFAGALPGIKWLFGTLTPQLFVYVSVGGMLAAVMLSALAGASNLPFEMLTFPKSRFGSFCSMQALLRSTSTTLVGLGVAWGFDWLSTCFPGSPTFHYRFVSVWPVLGNIPVVILAVLVYREWGRLGGYGHYACPAIWSPDGREPMEQPPERRPSAAILKFVLYGYDLLIVAGLAAAGWFAGRYYVGEDYGMALRFLLQAGGIAVATAVLWRVVRGKIFRDLRLCLSGRSPLNGIPHHGMLLLMLIVYFAGVILTVVQLLYLEPESGLAFLVMQLLGNFAVVVTIYLVCKMEKGIVMKAEA